MGLRIQWNMSNPVELPASQKWNPFSSEMPFVTLISHPGAAASSGSLRRASLLNSTFAPPTSLLPSSVASNQADVLTEKSSNDEQNSASGSQQPFLWCQIEDFRDKLMDICPAECRHNAHPVRFEHGEILIENYAGVVSKVANMIQVRCTIEKNFLLELSTEAASDISAELLADLTK